MPSIRAALKGKKIPSEDGNQIEPVDISAHYNFTKDAKAFNVDLRQIGSGEMNVANGRTEYAIDIIPNHKKTHTKVIVDAHTGAVLSSKQFGGLRGLAGWVRESAEHKENVNKAPNDTTMSGKTMMRDSTMMRDTTMRNMMRDTTTRRDTTIKRDTTVKRDTIPQ